MELNLKGIEQFENVTVRDMELLNELNTLNFPYRVFKKYKFNVKDNEEIEYEQARRKIMRDIVLGFELPTKDGIEYKRVFLYGNLMIHINTEEKCICYICDARQLHIDTSDENGTSFKISREKRKELNKIIGIGDVE